MFRVSRKSLVINASRRLFSGGGTGGGGVMERSKETLVDHLKGTQEYTLLPND